MENLTALKNGINESNPGHCETAPKITSQLTKETKISPPDAKDFMEKYVGLLFSDSSSIPLDLKSKFGVVIQTDEGRKQFCRAVTERRAIVKNISEDVLLNLVRHFTIGLFEAHLAEDFTSARIVMNMSFTFYYQGASGKQQYPYVYLREQPIFQDQRFWNAAFFDSLQMSRNAKPVLKNGCENGFSIESLENEQSFQANITFGLIGNFLCNMQALDLSETFCRTFLEKQCVIGDLPTEQRKMLNDYFIRLFNN